MLNRFLDRLRRRRVPALGVISSSPIVDPAPVRVHEAGIRAIFQNRVAWSGTAPVIDRPVLVLAFTNRSGSNLLADYLRQTGQVAGIGEYLNQETVARQADRYGIDSVPAYLQNLAGRLCSGHQQFGVKASAEQLQLLIEGGLLGMFRSASIVHIHRDDLMAQAVSHWIARQTGQWTSDHDRQGEAEGYDADAMLTIAADVLRQDGSIRWQCAAAALNYLSVSYEELVHDPAATLARIGAGAGLSLDGWTPAAPRISRQATARNDALKQRLIADARGRSLARPSAGA
ncbi:Stf0 family sulfotransferase [Paracoccus contaminans]|uniref:Sulphotransferase Stf0 domain-containing protein n=1 Tax=Paracoccus contaminans TaxID=1945662 RepID=A0A1W6CWE2_9RHOB|nr:Stf0 family sulfotransferase [Paracoccus contaminans]ARJ69174.1 hypothetical protein B0A89_05610 [Paracoccus contaminans]